MTGCRKGDEAGLTRAAWLDPRAVSRQETLKAEPYDFIILQVPYSLGRELAREDQEAREPREEVRGTMTVTCTGGLA